MQLKVFLITIFIAFSNLSFAQPNTIPNLALWFKADSGTVISGNQLTQWKDLSGNANDANQVNPSQQPLFVDSVPQLNNQPVIRFDGLDDFMEFFEITTIRSAFFVLKHRTGSQDYTPILGNPLLYDMIGGTGNNLFDNTFTSSNITGGKVYVNSDSTIPPLSILKPVNYTILSIVATGNFIAQYITNDRNTSGRYWDGDYAEIIIYDQALPGPDRTLVENYLYNKYAPRVDIVPDTTICFFPFTIRAKKDYFTAYIWSDTSTADSLIVNVPGTYSVTTTNIFGKTSSDSIRIKLDTTSYSVNLGSDTTLCYGQQLAINGGPTHLAYSWSTGSSINSIATDSTGAYFVSVTDCKTNTSRDTIAVTLRPASLFNFGADTLVCYTSPLILNPYLGNTVSYLWQDNSVDSLLAVNQSGKYWVRVTDAWGCFYSDTLNVAVDSFPQIATLGPDTTHCAGEQVFLTAGAPQAINYLWSTAATTSSIAVTSSGNYSVTATDALGCSAVDSINVLIKGVSPTVNFTADTVCFGNNTSFTDGSLTSFPDSIANWQWNFGDALTGSVQNPTHAYSSPGNYTVTLLVSTDSGCTNFIQKPVIVPAIPVAAFTPALACSGANVLFTDNTTISSGSIIAHQWDFGDIASGLNNFSSAPSPTHVFSLTGNYNVQLIVTSSFGCTDTIQSVVNVLQSPTAVFSYTTVCAGKPVSFSDNSISSTQWNWDFGDASANSTIKNPAHPYSTGGTYPVKLIITDGNGCKDTSVQAVPIYYRPIPGFLSGTPCKLEPFQFTDTSSVIGNSITQWKWSFGTLGTSVLQNPVFVFPNTGISNVKLVVTSQQGCVDSITKTFTTFPPPSAYFTTSANYGNPPFTVNFTNLSGGGATYLWDFGDSGSSTSTNPSHVYTGTDTFLVRLVTISSQGCHDTAWTTIFVWTELLDIAVTSVSADEQGNTMKITADIANQGTRDITYVELSAYLENGGTFQEIWTGLLVPGAGVTYDFKAAFVLIGAGEKNYFCVEANMPNGEVDDVPSNNKKCSSLSKNVLLLNPFPNPASGNISVFYNVPSGGEVEFEIYDVAGRRVEKISINASKGLNLLEYDAGVLANGTYALRMYYNGKEYVKVFVKR